MAYTRIHSMNIPGNKLKDLLGCLYNLDPDITHVIDNVECTMTKAGRHLLRFKTSADKTILLDDLLDDLFDDLLVDDYPIAEDIHTFPEFKKALLNHLINLHEEIANLKDEIDKLTRTDQSSQRTE